MSLVAFVASGKRFKFNVNAGTRSPANFTVDNAYLASRADHSKFRSRGDIIRSGPSVSRKSRRGRGKSAHLFPFSISGHFQTSHASASSSVSEHANHSVDNPDEAPKTLTNSEPENTPPPASTLSEHTLQAPDKVEDDSTLDTASVTNTHYAESPDVSFLRQLLGGGILCSKCVLGENGGRDGEIGNPTELSIFRAAYLGDVNVFELKDSAPVVAEVPFSSEYKFMATVHHPVEENDSTDYTGKLIVHVKGAPDRLIPFCKYQAGGGSIREKDMEPCDSSYWIDQIAILSSHGLRVLALTRGVLEEGSVAEGEQLGPEFVTERGEPWLTIVGLVSTHHKTFSMSLSFEQSDFRNNPLFLSPSPFLPEHISIIVCNHGPTSRRVCPSCPRSTHCWGPCRHDYRRPQRYCHCYRRNSWNRRSESPRRHYRACSGRNDGCRAADSSTTV